MAHGHRDVEPLPSNPRPSNPHAPNPSATGRPATPAGPKAVKHPAAAVKPDTAPLQGGGAGGYVHPLDAVAHLPSAGKNGAACGKCGYSLVGLKPGGACPECGAATGGVVTPAQNAARGMTQPRRDGGPKPGDLSTSSTQDMRSLRAVVTLIALGWSAFVLAAGTLLVTMFVTLRWSYFGLENDTDTSGGIMIVCGAVMALLPAALLGAYLICPRTGTGVAHVTATGRRTVPTDPTRPSEPIRFMRGFPFPLTLVVFGSQLLWPVALIIAALNPFEPSVGITTALYASITLAIVASVGLGAICVGLSRLAEDYHDDSGANFLRVCSVALTIVGVIGALGLQWIPSVSAWYAAHFFTWFLMALPVTLVYVAVPALATRTVLALWLASGWAVANAANKEDLYARRIAEDRAKGEHDRMEALARAHAKKP